MRPLCTAAAVLAGSGRGAHRRAAAAADIIFSPPVLIEATPGAELGADGFAAVDVDPSGEGTLLYGPGHWTSYDSGRSWASELPRGWRHMLPVSDSWTGESSGFRAPGARAVHNLGAIDSCNNISLWRTQRGVAWEGCHSTPPPALSEPWLTTSPSLSFWHKNATDGRLWSSSRCESVVFRGLPQSLNKEWGMCDGFTSPTRLELADGSVLATFPLVFAGEQPPRNAQGRSLIVNHLPMSLVVTMLTVGEGALRAPIGPRPKATVTVGAREADRGLTVSHGHGWGMRIPQPTDSFTFDFLAVAANYSQIPGVTSGPNPYHLNHSAYGPQENSMALLADNKTVMIAFRPDTDSMCPGGPVPYKFYYQ
eukprot:gene9674-6408_t